jgi:cephalosporin-C deacetylase
MKPCLFAFMLNMFLITASHVDAQNSGSKKMQEKNFTGHDKKSFADSTTKLQKDIAAFWKKTREELSAIPIDAKVEPLKEALPYHTYSITVQGLNNVTVAGFLSIPVQGEAPAKPWPVIVTASGYSGNGQGVMLSECQRGYVILQVYPRGQGESSKYFKLAGDKLSTNLDKPEGAYYQGAYADVMRMIDYIITRPDIDSSRIAMVSTSQGGGIALAVASLDKRVKAVVAHVPFLCNFRLAATIPKSLVKTLLDRSHTNNEAALQTLDYFDPLQLVPWLHVPVLMSAGGKDETCPMQTIQSVYDRISSNKQLKIYPNLPHTTCLDFYYQWWLWLDKYFKTPSSGKKAKKRSAIIYWKEK